MPSIGASGILGIAKETVSGTYVAPTKYIPFDSESLKWTQENQERRPIRNTPGLVGMIRGNGSVEGDIECDATVDVVAWLLTFTRCAVTKTGTGPYTYIFKPAAVAIPVNTCSITVKRGNETSGYVGCVVSSFSISVDDKGALKLKVSIIGASEATQTAPTPTWPTTVPFGAGMYNLQIPTATQIYDTDKYELSVEDSATAQYRLKNTLGAQFVSFGESSATVKVERDFENRANLDQYKATTANSITMVATQGTDSLTILTPVSYIESYEYNLSSVGDLVRASVEYKCAIDATGAHYTITVITTDNIL